MIKINLMGEKKSSSKARARPKLDAMQMNAQRQNLVFAAIIVTALVLAGGWWWTKSAEVADWKEKIVVVEAELKRLEPILEKQKRFEARKELLQNKINLITELKRKQDVPVHILDQVSRNLPEFLWLNKMSADNNRINVSGRATTYNAVSNFYKNLTDCGYFKDVSLGRTYEEKTGVTFSMTASYVDPAEPAADKDNG